MSPRLRLALLKWLVVANYLFATTVSGLFHDHGADHKCSGHGCAGHHCTAQADSESTAPATPESSEPPKHSCCKHAHHCHHHAPVATETAAKPAREAPSPYGTMSSAPSEHGPCYVCQFLAHHHAMTPVETISVVILPPPVEKPVTTTLKLATRSLSHSARGPPACA